MKKVYIAGKLNAGACDYIKNVHAMILAGDQIRRMGHSVFLPCLDLLSGLVMGNMEYEDYFENNIPWLKVADFLYVMPCSENSSGTQAEIKIAKLRDIPIITDINFFRGIL